MVSHTVVILNVYSMSKYVAVLERDVWSSGSCWTSDADQCRSPPFWHCYRWYRRKRWMQKVSKWLVEMTVERCWAMNFVPFVKLLPTSHTRSTLSGFAGDRKDFFNVITAGKRQKPSNRLPKCCTLPSVVAVMGDSYRKWQVITAVISRRKCASQFGCLLGLCVMMCKCE